jgi:hypothetical protein
VFLRGIDFLDTASSGSSLQTSETSVLRKGLQPNPMIMVGNNSLEISEDQAVFFPIAMSLVESGDNNISDSETSRRSVLNTQIGRLPKPNLTDQITVNGVPIDDDNFSNEDILIESPEFTLSIPDVPFGSSLKDFLNIPLKTPGKYQCVVGGYFLLIKFAPGDYIIHFFGDFLTNAGLELDHLEGLYNVRVNKIRTSSIRSTQKFTSQLLSLAKSKFDKGEIMDSEYKKLERIIKDSTTAIEEFSILRNDLSKMSAERKAIKDTFNLMNEIEVNVTKIREYNLLKKLPRSISRQDFYKLLEVNKMANDELKSADLRDQEQNTYQLMLSKSNSVLDAFREGIEQIRIERDYEDYETGNQVLKDTMGQDLYKKSKRIWI